MSFYTSFQERSHCSPGVGQTLRRRCCFTCYPYRITVITEQSVLGKGRIRNVLFSHPHCEYRYPSCQGSCVAPATKSRSHPFIIGLYYVAACPQVGLVYGLPDQPSTTTKGLLCAGTLLKGGWLKGLTLATASQHSPSAARYLGPHMGHQHIMNHSRRVQRGL